MRRYTIEGAQRVLKENGVRFVQAVGRGEAVATAPSLPDAAPPPDAAVDEAPRAGRAALEDALREFRACRDALLALRGPAAGA